MIGYFPNNANGYSFTLIILMEPLYISICIQSLLSAVFRETKKYQIMIDFFMLSLLYEADSPI
ncbi:hypothetical protein HMPREF9104_01998 [Lentilactobacillus kisonensis F0435]|uniref:Uncharacterized protein n=1 Tax=Lentilactobacillus kisonensis F0435 TaxID=797516 RepID=H1LHA8_9LACO|nr:hypothetical protein HMPREF9104_01998 [Lentilactobacillus kisonensis F0435]